MAEPARQLPDDDRPNIRPNLHVLQGGGETSEPSGNLSAVDDSGDGAADGPQLEALEGGGETSEPRRGHLSSADGKGGLYNSEDGKDKDSKASTPGEVGAAEAGSLFNPTNVAGGGVGMALRGLGLTKKRGIGGGIGLLIAGSVFFGGSIASGPFQFIHMAQLLQQFHLQEQQDQSDDRMSKLTRFWRYAKTGKVEQTRLGVFANSYANKIEAKLNESGITSSFDKYGRFNGYVIDTENENFKGKTADEIKQQFKEQWGADVTTEKLADSKTHLVVNAEKNGYFAKRKIIGSILKTAGYKGVTGAVKARIMGKRAGITWHPITRLDNSIKSKVADIIDATRKKFGSDVSQGNTGQEITTTSSPNDQTTDPAQQEADAKAAAKASTETNQSIKDIESASAGGTALKLAGGAAALTGVACVLSGLDKQAGTIKEAQVIEPIIRTGMEFTALGGQAMFGGQGNPNFLTQLGALSYHFNGTQKGNKGSALGAQSIQAEQGKTENGVAPDSTLTSLTKGSPLSFINSGALGTAVGVTCSKAGQFVIGGFSFITGPASFVAGILLSKAIEAAGVLNTVAGWLSGTPIQIAKIVGPQFGNYLNFGVKMGANDAALAAGGVALTPAEVVQLDAQQSDAAQSAFQHQSFASRIFNPYSSKSLVGSLIDKQDPSISGNTTQLADGFLHFGSSLLSLPGMLFGGKASALGPDTAYDYGFPTIGFSAAELNDPQLDNPYTNADYVINNLLTPDNIAKAQKCFGVTIAPDGSSVMAAGDTITNMYDTANYSTSDCGGHSVTASTGGKTNATFAVSTNGSTTANDATSNGSKATAKLVDASNAGGNDWLRLRMFITDSEDADSMSCYQGDPQSCVNVGFINAAAVTSSSSSGDPSKVDQTTMYQDSTNVPCAPGTDDAGIQDGYHNNIKVKIRVCGIPGIPSTSAESHGGYGSGYNGGNALVNSRVSANYLALANAAKDPVNGAKLAASSSFRTMAHQQSLCPCDGVNVARPGYSNHQMGLAIDFAVPENNKGSCSSGRAEDTEDPMWDWLENHAATWGIRQYGHEAWHWDTLDDSTRCGGDGT